MHQGPCKQGKGPSVQDQKIGPDNHQPPSGSASQSGLRARPAEFSDRSSVRPSLARHRSPSEGACNFSGPGPEGEFTRRRGLADSSPAAISTSNYRPLPPRTLKLRVDYPLKETTGAFKQSQQNLNQRLQGALRKITVKQASAPFAKWVK